MTNYTSIANYPKAIACAAMSDLNAFCYAVYFCGGAYYNAKHVDLQH